MDPISTDIESTDPLQENPVEKKINVRCWIIFSIFILIFSIIPLAAIIIGIYFQNKCPIYPFITICLIILGSSNLGIVLFTALLLLNFMLSEFPDDSNSTRTTKCRFWTINCIIMIIIITLILSLFVFNGIFLAIRRDVKKKIQFNNISDTRTYCHPIAYYAIATFTISTLLSATVCCWIPRIYARLKS